MQKWYKSIFLLCQFYCYFIKLKLVHSPYYTMFFQLYLTIKHENFSQLDIFFNIKNTKKSKYIINN